MYILNQYKNGGESCLYSAEIARDVHGNQSPIRKLN